MSDRDREQDTGPEPPSPADRIDALLDEALEETFPASDPPAHSVSPEPMEPDPVHRVRE